MGGYFVSRKINNFQYRNSYYNNYSVAYDYEEEYEIYEHRKPKNHALKNEFKLQKRILAWQRLKLISSVVIVFFGCITTMVMHANIEEQSIVNNRIQDKISEIQNANNMLTAEITEQLSLDFIEKEATIRLGMSEPQAYQICYINVPKQSYTVQYDIGDSNSKVSFDIGAILNVFKKD